MTRLTLLSFCLAACTAPPDTGPPGDGVLGDLLVATTDFSVGSLAAVDLDQGQVFDDLTVTSGDPSVVFTGGQVVQLNGFLSDFVRLYTPGIWDVPDVEFSLGQGANPHDAVIIDGELWLSLYDRGVLEVWDPVAGVLLDTVDLAGWADEDGNPEPSTLLVVDGTLLVALERLDRTAGWVGRPGRVLAVEPATRRVWQEWTTASSPRLVARTTEAGTAWVVTGSYTTVNGVVGPALDGDVRPFDVVDGLGVPVWVEADEGVRVDRWTQSPLGDVVALLDRGDGQYQVRCGAPGALREGPITGEWLSDVVIDEIGDAWIAARTLTGGGVLWGIDRGACAESARLPTTLAPYRLALTR